MSLVTLLMLVICLVKLAFSAESQAKILSLNLVNRILEKAYLDPVFLNTCYSFSSYDRAFSITSWYRLNIKNDKIVSLEVLKALKMVCLMKG